MAITYISKIQAIGSAEEYVIKDAEARSNLDTHVHGNISRDGKVSQTATIASGDKLLIADSSNNDTVIGSAITFGTSTTTFLSNKGTWATPAITGFDSAKTIDLTGDVTGSASGGNGSNGWSIATTIGTGKVTNAMLAGSITNSKLVNSKVTIAGNDVSLGGSLAADTLRSSLGLSNAMHFKGTTTTALTDGTTTAAVTISGSSYAPEAGDVVLYSDSEFVWTGSAWERLGRDSSFKVTQTAVTDTAYTGSDTATTFVSAVTQDSNGNITVTKRKLPTYNNYSHPTTTAVDAAAVKVGKDNLGHVVIGAALTKSDVGLGNVENKSSATIRGELTSSNVTTALGFTPYNSTNPNGYTTNTGTVTSITPGNGLLNGTGTSAITTSGTLNLNYGSSASAVSTTAVAGTANTVSRSDHVHSIALATGDANGQVKIAGTNINVKGLGSAAYTESNAYAASSHTHYWANIATTTAAAYNTAPEMATLKLNGNTSASAASTSNVTLVFDATLQALNFVFA